MTKKILLASIAAGALVLSACGGDTDEATTPAPTTTAAAPAESTAAPTETATATVETSEAATETTDAPAPSETVEAPAEPAGDLPFAVGDVDVMEFTTLVADATKSVKTMKTTSTQTGSDQPNVTYTDLSDRNNPVTYSVTEAGGSKIEMVSDNKQVSSRTDGGEWETQPHSQEILDMIEQAGDTQSPEYMAKAYQSVELVDPATREFNVVMDLSAALGGPAAGEGQGMPVTLWLDENNRIIKQEIAMGEMSVTNEMEYDVPVEIPAVN